MVETAVDFVEMAVDVFESIAQIMIHFVEALFSFSNDLLLLQTARNIPANNGSAICTNGNWRRAGFIVIPA